MSKNVPTNRLWRKSVEEKFWSDFNGCSAKRGAKLNPNDECRRKTEIRRSKGTPTDAVSSFRVWRFGFLSTLGIRHSEFHPVRCPAAPGLQRLRAHVIEARGRRRTTGPRRARRAGPRLERR